MPRIKMLRSTPGSEDGLSTNLYLKDHEYDVPHELALAFITHMGVAVQVRVRVANPEPSEKAVIEKVPEIKVEPVKPVVLVTEEEEVIKEKESVKEFEPKNTRVYEVANELKIPWKEVIEIAQKLGIEVRVAQAGLTDSEVEKIKSAGK